VEELKRSSVVGAARLLLLLRAFNNNTIPTCIFQLRGEAPSEIAAREPFNRIPLGSETLHFASAGA
jgi:hypothetical protein